MILMVCLDDNNGMMFNKRRQSQDRVLREEIIKEASGERLWMNHYSYKQFSDSVSENIESDDNFLDKADLGEYCFVENVCVSGYEKKIEKIIIYKWNRRYPSDLRFDIPLAEHGWRLLQVEEFTGFSHERISKEIYER